MSEAFERVHSAPQKSLLSVVQPPAVRSTFAALDPAVATAVGNRAAAALYGVFATKWYEFATPEKLATIKAKTGRSIVPGDWVSISYRELMKKEEEEERRIWVCPAEWCMSRSSCAAVGA